MALPTTPGLGLPIATNGKIEFEQSIRFSMAILATRLSLTLPIRTEGMSALRSSYKDAVKQIAAALQISLPTDRVDDGMSNFKDNFIVTMATVDLIIAGGGGGVNPKPAVTQAGSISPTSGTAGQTQFTSTDPVFSNTTSVTRQWLLGSTALTTGATITPQTAGALTCVWVGHGPGGDSDPVTSSAVTVAAAGSLQAPVLSPQGAAGVNPLLPSIDLDATVHAWGDGNSEDGTYDFLLMQRGAVDYSSPASDLVRLNPDLLAVLNDPTASAASASAFPTCLINQPAGATRLRAKVRRGSVPGRIINLGDSMTVNDYNWIKPYATAHPEFEILRNANSGRSIDNDYDGNGVLQHVNEVQALAPQVICGLVGANDIPGLTPQQWFDKLTNLWAVIRAACPRSRLTWSTLIPVYEAALGTPYAGFNVKADAVNVMIRNAVGTLIDACCDFAANANVSAARNNPAFFKGDGLHPVDNQPDLIEVYAAFIPAQIAAAQSWLDSAFSNDLIDTIPYGVPVAVAALDPNHVIELAILSNNNRRLEVTNNSLIGARTVTTKNAGLLYMEFQVIAFARAGPLWGVCNANYDPILAPFTGPPVGSAVYATSIGDNFVDKDGVAHTVGPNPFHGPYAQGMLCDFTARTVTFYVDNSPVITLPMPTGPLYLFMCMYGSGTVMEINTGQTTFNFSVPTGASMWG